MLDLRGGAGGSGGWLAGSRSVRDSFALMKFVHWPSRQPDRTGHLSEHRGAAMFTVVALLIPNAFVHNAALHSAIANRPPLSIKASSTNGAQPRSNLMENALVAAGAFGGVSTAAFLGVMLSGASADMSISMLHHGAFHSPTCTSLFRKLAPLPLRAWCHLAKRLTRVDPSIVVQMPSMQPWPWSTPAMRSSPLPSAA